MTTTKYRTGMRMTLDEFLDIGETDGKWELDDGVLYIMPFWRTRPPISDGRVYAGT